MSLSKQLSQSVDKARPLLLEITDQQSASKPAPDKWSAKEILGHLIDSAINNHARFVKAQWMDNLVFPGYRQEDWVKTSGYQTADWQALVELWSGINLNMARMISNIPADILAKKHMEHSLDSAAWMTIEKGAPATLGYFIADYIAHMEHHLRQIMPEFVATTSA